MSAVRPPDLAETVSRWIADDPDPATRQELRLLLDAYAGEPGAEEPGGGAPEAGRAGAGAATRELTERFAGPLRFGTAGLRGPVRAGPNGMNVAVVRRTTAGLAGWLRARGHGGGTVVVGRDARHGSEAFAAATAGVFAAAGFDVRTLPGPLPTPVLAFAVRALGAVAGVQITASHNPAPDNGYKVYLHDGAQLVTPSDTEIEAAIADAPPAAAIPVIEPAGTAYDPLPAYLRRVAGLPGGGDGGDGGGARRARGLRIALTPLHGVGGAVAVAALGAAGFSDVHVVAEQADPDPDFPTVSSPNPEDPRATEALLALAAVTGAQLAIALDPDADRCALGVPEPGTGTATEPRLEPGTATGWRMLTGDEVGALLGEHLLSTRTWSDPLVASTVVSSSLLAKVAAAHGARHAETQTGFKWIMRAGGPEETRLVYGYEEAIGYCVDPGAVRDKDGISAAVLAADLAAIRADAGSSLLEALDELAVRHGVHTTRSLTFPMTPDECAAALDRVARAWDAERPAPELLVIHRPGSRVAVRPSGTEPKLKAYLEVVEPVAGQPDLIAARQRAGARLAMLVAETATLIGGPPSPPC
ncbi:MAG TPA: phospho-sugar mutase [Pseudonocardia sp.]|nr:phospho-sugar mutase [Pseudonocardia sp.]